MKNRWRAFVRLNVSRSFVALAIVTGLIFSGAQTAAVTTTISGYKAKGNLQPAMLASLVPGSKDTVQVLPAKSPQQVLGVVIDPSDVPLTTRSPTSQIYVASTGSYPVLVSNQNGSIKSGDYIAVSTIDGVAAKARPDQALVIGRALQDFKAGSSTIFNAGDNSAVGKILAQIQPGSNPNVQSDVGIPSTLRRVGRSIAGKNVSALRIFGSVTVLFIGILTAGFLLLGGIRSALYAIGRNPLSRKSIYRGLAQVLVVSILVFVASLMGIYILLKI